MHAHVARRHPESAHLAVPAGRDDLPATRRLHVEAVPITEATPPPASRAHAADVEFARELEEIRERLRNTESQLVEERNSRNELLKKVDSSFIQTQLTGCQHILNNLNIISDNTKVITVILL